ncbi:hypothetical protein HYE21_00870 [Mycoplasmopsis bovis]|nr:hypothetical protein [Mycoplasmopsis bovis]QQH24290.1 hypothetical protein HYE21_00870 [Mycoplasmopsis bovis]
MHQSFLVPQGLSNRQIKKGATQGRLMTDVKIIYKLRYLYLNPTDNFINKQ